MPNHKRTIEVIVQPTGAITIEAQNFKGRGCEEATRFLEDTLGKVESRKRKSDYYQSSDVRINGSTDITT